jgi:hypothetical protein
MTDTDNADDGAAEVGGYSAAEAAHTFEEYLEGRLSLQGFQRWLEDYPSSARGPSDHAVEDEIDRALLAVRALQRRSRSRREVRRELRLARGRLSGLARQ